MRRSDVSLLNIDLPWMIPEQQVQTSNTISTDKYNPLRNILIAYNHPNCYISTGQYSNNACKYKYKQRRFQMELKRFPSVFSTTGEAWKQWQNAISQDQLYNNSSITEQLLHDMVSAPIVGLRELPDSGTQIKLLLKLQDGSQAIFKPMRYRNTISFDYMCHIPRTHYIF